MEKKLFIPLILFLDKFFEHLIFQQQVHFDFSKFSFQHIRQPLLQITIKWFNQHAFISMLTASIIPFHLPKMYVTHRIYSVVHLGCVFGISVTVNKRSTKRRLFTKKKIQIFDQICNWISFKPLPLSTYRAICRHWLCVPTYQNVSLFSEYHNPSVFVLPSSKF